MNSYIKARQNARALALQCLYQWDFHNKEELQENAEYFLSQINKDDYEKAIQKRVLSYTSELVHSVIDNIEAIDDCFIPFLRSDWAVDRIPKVEKTLIRICVAEMYFVSEKVPKEIAINEALELTKNYGNEDSEKYVNGILNQVAKNLPDKQKK